ncbi:Glycolipid 2-alpha-mannosyltransferase [Wickerhamomyces ciferrii]|uniref:Glycolipid 2-alpha-mannosyltransferase n=1 Tax=Wickerhamomyces ciferrii (strain ATCC 14091 / BCRC 22168 / CBS 111 / JCM 3599 / NBRC 0793 / NRRL Y-1031 F-60-10) TaxID=1206466 RepID=K0KXI4_WICCF|nr:Glycolipid 2-alpha-mannosyltransferase [Wickerhamomyces ciferrii]CCH46194.1 Glycolipid 2-alpha-mannosyltransferase [Wickerhamomyces ciferrii]
MPTKRSVLRTSFIALLALTIILIISTISYTYDYDVQDLKDKIVDKFGKESPTENQKDPTKEFIEDTSVLNITDQKVESEYQPISKPMPNLENENAVLFTLARNSDLNGILQSIKNLESSFNKNYHYPWYFANNEPFDDEFKTKVDELVSGEVEFITIPKEYWSYPDFIDLKKAERSRRNAANAGMMYGDSESYRHMCRFNSGFFYKLKELQKFDYYWRVEPDVKFKCDINYDVFKKMKQEDKMYGFNMGLTEDSKTIPTLWDSVKEFMKENKDLISQPNNLKFISDDDGETYNMCHFWSNFEIGSFKFFRSEKYEKFFQFLDSKGGFFYERWGDAPVHTIAASLLLSPDQIQFVANTGYFHHPNQDCPRVDSIREELNCRCSPNRDFTWHRWSCVNKYFEVNNMEKLNGGIEKRDEIEYQAMEQRDIMKYLYGL